MYKDPGQEQYFDRSLGQVYLLALENLLERQGMAAAHPGNKDTSVRHIGKHSTARALLAADILDH